MSMEDHAEMMPAGENSWLVRQSCLAILPAIKWEQVVGMDVRSEGLAL
jgi:hypothetical protein